MNIFKAVEIYKRIPHLPPNLNPLRAIRGLWVSGVHLNNITIDATLHVTGETSNHCEERAYTDQYDETYLSGNVNIIDIETNTLNVQEYTIQNNETYLQGNVNIINIESNQMNITYYTISNQDAYLQGNINIIEMFSSIINVADYVFPRQYVTLPEKTGQNPAEPTLLIEAFTSNQLEWQ